MKVTRGYRDLGLDLAGPAVTIGNFDGVHLGHRAVMQSALDAAAARGCETVVCTFDPHTAYVLRPHAAPPLLQSLAQKLDAIAALGVGRCVVIPFDLGVAATGHRHFVDQFLRREVHVGSLHVSKGFSFGRDRAGSTAYLERRSRQCGFSVQRVAPLLVDGAPISSSRVRELLAGGEVAGAAALLGRPFALRGRVVRGAGRGAGIGASTANLALPDSACLPARGVYVTRTHLGGGIAPSITNVGFRPTFEPAAARPVVETHLLEGDADAPGGLYDREIEVAFLSRLRDERRFAGRDELAAQVRLDISRARQVHGLLPVPGGR